MFKILIFALGLHKYRTVLNNRFFCEFFGSFHLLEGKAAYGEIQKIKYHPNAQKIHIPISRKAERRFKINRIKNAISFFPFGFNRIQYITCSKPIYNTMFRLNVRFTAMQYQEARSETNHKKYRKQVGCQGDVMIIFKLAFE